MKMGALALIIFSHASPSFGAAASAVAVATAAIAVTAGINQTKEDA